MKPFDTSSSQPAVPSQRVVVTLLSYDPAAVLGALPMQIGAVGGHIHGLRIERSSVPGSGERIERVELVVSVPARFGIERLAARLEDFGDAHGCCAEVAAQDEAA